MNNWNVSNGMWTLKEVSSQVEKLNKSVYKVEFHPAIGHYLSPMGDKFPLPSKIYGVERKLIDRVVTSYQALENNMGVLLNGIKGTGKTVTAMQIANELDLPILVVTSYFPDLTDFLMEIEQDIVILFDEFEKMYNDSYRKDNDPKLGSTDSLLSLMDGALRGDYRKTFLLTTNEPTVNKYMLQRPGRIRYLKTFGDMTPEVIEEIIDDTLKYPDFKSDCIEVISGLSIITMDLVKSIIEEVNIHNESPKEFIEVFNVNGQKTDNKYNVFVINPTTGKEETLLSSSHLSFTKIDQTLIGQNINDNMRNIGKVLDIRGNDLLKVKLETRFLPDECFEIYSEPDEDDERGEDGKIIMVKRRRIKEGEEGIRILRIEQAVILHSNYYEGFID